MWFVVQTILARGPAARPVASPGHRLILGIEPISDPAERIAVQSLAGVGRCITSQEPSCPRHPMTNPSRIGCRHRLADGSRREKSLSLHPSTWRALLPPRPQTTFMETMSSRPMQKAFVIAFIGASIRLWR
jgi:hypothetical protein